MSDQISPLPIIPKRNFEFIDAIRCIAMIGIVMEHSVWMGNYIFPDLSVNNLAYMSLIQLPKFGTISFFLLAGFLIGDKFKDYTPLEYFKRRLSNTFKPWILWSLVFFVALLINRWIILHKAPGYDFGTDFLQSISIVYLYSNYWFIINFLICIGVLLIFRKYLYSNWLGGVLLVASLGYSLNIYHGWFEPTHTRAIFGFVFYLWLGAKFYQKWNVIEAWIKRTSIVVFLLFTAAAFCLALTETANLWLAKSIDPFNTLRFTNILYSVAMILLLLKIKDFSFVKYIKPRETTYGIYLIHFIFVYSLLPEIFRPMHLRPIDEMNLVVMLLYALLRLAIVYGLTLGLVTLINRTKLKWTIGR